MTDYDLIMLICDIAINNGVFTLAGLIVFFLFIILMIKEC